MTPSVFDCGRSLKRNFSGGTPREAPGLPSQNAEVLQILVDRRDIPGSIPIPTRETKPGHLSESVCLLTGNSTLRDPLIRTTNHKQTYFRLSFPFAILYKHRCLYYLFICLNFAFRNYSKQKTHTYSSNAAVHCSCGLFDL